MYNKITKLCIYIFWLFIIYDINMIYNIIKIILYMMCFGNKPKK